MKSYIVLILAGLYVLYFLAYAAPGDPNPTASYTMGRVIVSP